MKTLTKKITAFLKPNGELSFFAFPIEVVTSGKFGNFEVVEQMAKDGDLQAISAIERLKEMTSRQRSESGIYYKLQQKKSFNKTKGKMFGVTPFIPVNVEFTAEISRVSKSRLKTFENNAYALGNPLVKIPYTSEFMLINKKIILNG